MRRTTPIIAVAAKRDVKVGPALKASRGIWTVLGVISPFLTASSNASAARRLASSAWMVCSEAIQLASDARACAVEDDLV